MVRVKTILLLAGRSRRFWPLSEKSLFPILGKTLLEHQVRNLRDGGCKDIILVGGAHNLKDAAALFPDFSTVEQIDLDRGMQGAMEAALPMCGSEPVLIVSSNDVIDPRAYKDLWDTAAKKGVDGVLLAYRVQRYFPGGYLTVDGERVTGIVEKPGAGNEPSDLVNIVAHVHNDPIALLEALRAQDTSNDDGYERAIAALLPKKRYEAMPYEGPWQAVKYPWHLLPLAQHFLGTIEKQQIHKKAFVHPSATVEGNVIIEEGAKILAHASVSGPCYIGRNTVVGNGALVRGSSVGADCVVGFGSEVKGSVLASHVWTHMTYLGDSIIGRNVSFGGGTITGNFRLDEAEVTSKSGDADIPTGLQKLGLIVGDDCRFGIRVGSNPGLKVGPKTFVTGGVYLTEDVSEKSFVTMKEGKQFVRENRMDVPSIDARTQYRPG